MAAIKAKPRLAIREVTPFLWFDGDAEDAAKLYTSIFPRSKIRRMAHYGPEGPGPKGAVMLVEFEIAGQQVFALNGGPQFPHTEAFSMHVSCEDQATIDALWAALAKGGNTSACGWLKDKFGLSWQIDWEGLPRLLAGKDREKASRVMRAMLEMTKIEIAPLEAAAKAPDAAAHKSAVR